MVNTIKKESEISAPNGKPKSQAKGRLKTATGDSSAKGAGARKKAIPAPTARSAIEMARVKVCSTGEMLDRQKAALEKVSIERANPLVLAYHGVPGEAKGTGALSLVFGEFSLVVELDRIPVEKLKDFLCLAESKSDFFVVVDGAVAGLMGCASMMPPPVKFYNLQLGHELLFGSCGEGLSKTAAMLGVTAKNIAAVPTGRNTENGIRSLFSGAKDGRTVFLAMHKRLNAKRWQIVSLEDAHGLALQYAKPFHFGDMPLAQRIITFDWVNFSALSTVLNEEEEGGVVTTVSTVDNVEDSVAKMLEVLPEAWRDSVDKELAPLLVDVQLDIGRAPVAHFRDSSRRILSDGPHDVVTNEDLQTTLDGVVNGFDEDNRGGIADSLHRVSVLKGRSGDPVGATLRIGRHVRNAAAVLFDVLRSKAYGGASILVVGPPAAGKTTMVRDVARILSETLRVMIVDSSDEIGGPDVVPHESVGQARRMSVLGGKRRLAFALIEAVENHTPDVILADELSNRNEVAGIITARQRGVRVIASAHGSLRSVVRNPVLRPLLGGLDRVVFSDASCRGDMSGKVRSVRAAETVFDVVVEMGVYPHVPSAVRIVQDVHAAVDAVMDGKLFTCDTRWVGQDDSILSATIYA